MERNVDYKFLHLLRYIDNVEEVFGVVGKRFNEEDSTELKLVLFITK